MQTAPSVLFSDENEAVATVHQQVKELNLGNFLFAIDNVLIIFSHPGEDKEHTCHVAAAKGLIELGRLRLHGPQCVSNVDNLIQAGLRPNGDENTIEILELYGLDC
jgi:hypothetical protein